MGVEDILSKDHKVDTGKTPVTIKELQDFIGWIPKMMTGTFEVEDEKKEVEYSEKFQVQNLEFQVNLKSQGGLLVVTLQCQIVKGIDKANSRVHTL